MEKMCLSFAEIEQEKFSTHMLEHKNMKIGHAWLVNKKNFATHKKREMMVEKRRNKL